MHWAKCPQRTMFWTQILLQQVFSQNSILKSHFYITFVLIWCNFICRSIERAIAIPQFDQWFRSESRSCGPISTLHTVYPGRMEQIVYDTLRWKWCKSSSVRTSSERCRSIDATNWRKNRARATGSGQTYRWRTAIISSPKSSPKWKRFNFHLIKFLFHFTGERLTDLTFWRNELAIELEKVIAEYSLLCDMKRRTTKALEDLDPPLKVTQECLYFRENRQGVEKVHDIVETTLLTEVQNLKNAQDRLKQCLEQVR